MNLSTPCITTFLTLHEKFLWLRDSLLGQSKEPQDNADLNRKTTRVEKRFELAARRFMHFQPVWWKKENSLSPSTFVDRETIAINMDYYVSCYVHCFTLMVLKEVNPHQVFTPSQQRTIDLFAASTAINFSTYLNETLVIYGIQPQALVIPGSGELSSILTQLNIETSNGSARTN